MITFNCEYCNYTTNNKSNYNKHLKTTSHINNVKNDNSKTSTNINVNYNTTKLIKNDDKFNNTKIQNKVEKYKCPKCNKILSSAPSLSRHKNKFCSSKNEFQNNDEFKKQLSDIQTLLKIKEIKYENKLKLKELETENKLKMQELDTENKLKIEKLEAKVKLLKTYINSGKSNNINNNVNITVIKYAKENYPDAPALTKMDDYACLENGEDEMVDAIINHQKNNNIHKYLGDFIIKYYKKDNQSDQSLWNTDVSRLSYIIKELVSNEKSVWTKDKEGVKTKKYIIDPST